MVFSVSQFSRWFYSVWIPISILDGKPRLRAPLVLVIDNDNDFWYTTYRLSITCRDSAPLTWGRSRTCLSELHLGRSKFGQFRCEEANRFAIWQRESRTRSTLRQCSIRYIVSRSPLPYRTLFRFLFFFLSAENKWFSWTWTPPTLDRYSTTKWRKTSRMETTVFPRQQLKFKCVKLQGAFCKKGRSWCGSRF